MGVKLSDYISLCAARIPHALQSTKPMPEAERFPCKACHGEGALATYTKFSPIRKPHQYLSTEAKQDIVCCDVMPCPPCAGTGLDQDAFVKHLGALDIAQSEVA